MLIHAFFTAVCLVGEFVFGQEVQTLTHTLLRTTTPPRTTAPPTPTPATHHVTSTARASQHHVTSTARASQHDVTTIANNGEIDDRLERSRAARMFFLRQHVLDSLGWTSTPDIDSETKKLLLLQMHQTPVYVTQQKYCYYPTCDLPMIEMPDYMNRSIWFDTSSRNIRYFFSIPSNTDPNLDVTSAVVRIHLKRRDDCLCAFEGEQSTSRLHIKLYQYRKPIRSHARLRHSNMRLIDAKMVTWDSARWVSLYVTEAVKRIVTRGRRNGGFEVHIRDMEEHILDAKTIIDPTVCTPVTEYECTHENPIYAEEDTGEPDDPNYSPILEISTTTTTRLEIS